MEISVSVKQERGLARQAQRDAEAFAALYDRYFPRIYAYIAYRVGSRELAEDLTAAIFERAFRNLADFRPRGDGSFSSWFYRIARNAVADNIEGRAG